MDIQDVFAELAVDLLMDLEVGGKIREKSPEWVFGLNNWVDGGAIRWVWEVGTCY